MANLFDRTYDKLLNLKEDLSTIPEVDKFFNTFLTNLAAQISSLDPTIALGVTKFATATNIEETKVTALALIRILTTTFDLQNDFDYTNPVAHKGWEEYKYKKLAATTTLKVLEYLTNFEQKSGKSWSAVDNQFSNIEVKVNSVDFDSEPYAYKYLTGNNAGKIRVSNFAKELDVSIELQLSYDKTNTAVEDITDIVNKYFIKIAKELQDTPGAPSKSEAEFADLLDGITWKAKFNPIESDYHLFGTGYTKELKSLIANNIKIISFIITGGDF